MREAITVTTGVRRQKRQNAGCAAAASVLRSSRFSGGGTMHYRDLRGWIEGVESFGELRVIEGADWNQEIGAVAEVAARAERPPAVLFDKIQDYAAGRRVLTGIHNPTLRRQCLTNHLPLDYTRDQFMDAWKKRLNDPQLIPPRVVDSGPVMENVFEGKEIDVLSLPVPLWHEGDGGRYI